MSEYGRRTNIKVTIDLWKWPEGQMDKTEDLTNDILSYRFQKTIKSIQGTCQIAMLPQRATTNIMTIIHPMDVIKIYEFGTLKFIGYVIRVSYDGGISADGKPNRSSTITLCQMGGLFETTSIGLELGTALGSAQDDKLKGGLLQVAAKKLIESIIQACDDGTSFSELTKLTIDSLFTYIADIGGKNLVSYMDMYFDYDTALVSKSISAVPKAYEIYSGNEESINLWDIINPLVERPFNELWIDNGPRDISIDGKTVSLTEKACLVFRATPFNGTIVSGSVTRPFDSLPEIHIDKDYLMSFGLAKSMEEVYTLYNVKEPAYIQSTVTRQLLGQYVIDTDKIGQYLLKPLTVDLFFTQILNPKGDAELGTQSTLLDLMKDYATTLLNWFKNNDKFVSGVITMAVPDNAKYDPGIGDKISVYGIDGYFYVEGIAHTWTYGGALKSDLTVTRGFNGEKPMEFTNQLFTRSNIT